MQKLLAEKLFEDKRVQEAISTLVKCAEQHCSHITSIRGLQHERVVSYQALLNNFSQLRGGNLWYPYVGSGIGKGPFVELLDGSIKYDFISGIGTHYFGHSHPKVIEAVLKASLTGTVMQGNLQQTASSYAFSQKLLKLANAHGAHLSHVFLTSTGVMAGENALKIALQKKHPASRILAFERCFAGRTLTFSQITDKPDYRVGLPTPLPIDYIPFFDKNDPQNSQNKAVDTLKKFIHRYPKQHACMFFELVLGEAGYYEGSSEFHKSLMEVCKENGIAILADEVQTFGRSSRPFMFQYYGLDEFIDIVWVGKACHACATLFTEEMCPKPGLLSQTFTASETAIATGKVVLDLLEKDGYLGADGKISTLSKAFREGLEAIHLRHPTLLQGPYGVGMMIAFTPFGGDAEKAKAFLQALFKNGVIGFIAGSNPTRARFLPPVLVTEISHIHEVCKIIEKTLIDLK